MPRTLTKVRVYNPGVRKVWKGLNRRVTKASIPKTGEWSNQRSAKISYYRGQSLARKAKRSSNPTKRKLTLAQKLHFGTKRQRSAAMLSLSRAGKKKRVSNRSKLSDSSYMSKDFGGRNRKIRKAGKSGNIARSIYLNDKRRARAASRIGNPGEIITLAGLAGNPGRLRKRKVGNIMAKRRRKSVSGVRRRTRRVRRANPKVVVRYRNRRTRRANTGRVRSVRRHSRRRTHRRSNPGFLSGGVGMLVGIFGGAALTGAIAARIPGQLNSGIAGYLTTGVIAYAQGTLAGKLLKNPALGKNMVTGGLIYLGLKVAGDLIPGLSLPFGLSGLGAIASSNFAYPQIPASNTMLYPNMAPAMAAAKGVGRIARQGRSF